MTYIATFFTHFAAVNFSRQLREAGQKPMLMPVPRKLSSSCGTGDLVQDDNYTPVYDTHIREKQHLP